MKRIRNLIDCMDGFLHGKRLLILDRDRKFTAQFKNTFRVAGVALVITCYQAPNMNAYAERFVRSIKRECLDRMIFVGEGALRESLREYVVHYHSERPHQGIGNAQVHGEVRRARGPVAVRERLGGLLKHNYQAAA